MNITRRSFGLGALAAASTLALPAWALAPLAGVQVPCSLTAEHAAWAQQLPASERREVQRQHRTAGFLVFAHLFQISDSRCTRLCRACATICPCSPPERHRFARGPALVCGLLRPGIGDAVRAGTPMPMPPPDGRMERRECGRVEERAEGASNRSRNLRPGGERTGLVQGAEAFSDI